MSLGRVESDISSGSARLCASPRPPYVPGIVTESVKEARSARLFTICIASAGAMHRDEAARAHTHACICAHICVHACTCVCARAPSSRPPPLAPRVGRVAEVRRCCRSASAALALRSVWASSSLYLATQQFDRACDVSLTSLVWTKFISFAKKGPPQKSLPIWAGFLGRLFRMKMKLRTLSCSFDLVPAP